MIEEDTDTDFRLPHTLELTYICIHMPRCVPVYREKGKGMVKQNYMSWKGEFTVMYYIYISSLYFIMVLHLL